MAVRKRIVCICLGLLVLAGCSSGTERQTANFAFEAVTSAFNRPEPSRVKFDRATLDEAGVDRSLMVARLAAPEQISAGLIVDTEIDGVLFWRAGDNGLIKTKDGVLAGTVGIAFDLYSAETANTVRALQTQSQEPYVRVYRHLNILNRLDVIRFWCTLSAPTRETVVVFERSHRVLKFVEQCRAETPDPIGRIAEIQNTFWRGVDRQIVWKSDQWISERTGNVVLERVIE